MPSSDRPLVNCSCTDGHRGDLGEHVEHHVAVHVDQIVADGLVVVAEKVNGAHVLKIRIKKTATL